MAKRSVLLALAASAGIWAQAAIAQDVVRPEAAFPYELTATEASLRLEFDVLDGYYLYRERFGFETDSAGITLGAPVFPVGEVHEDEFFGKQEIYRHDFTIEIPYRRTGAALDLELQVRLQGCADIGLCYPPQRWSRDATLPPSRAAAVTTSSGGVPDSIFGTARGPISNEPLRVEEAFVPNPRFDKANELTIAWQIEPGYYLYRDKFAVEADGGVEFGNLRMPAGVKHNDENFGDVEVFFDFVEVVVPFSRASPNEIPTTIRASFQGCKEASICYPPNAAVMSLDIPPSADFPVDEAALSAAASSGQMVSEQDRFSALILGNSWLMFLGTFFLAGLALSLTPCVLPMIPILSSIIAGQGNISTQRGFALSVSYVMGMAVTYTAAGALAALAGGQIQAIFQKPWIIASFAGLFAILALGMFGLFELQMPASVQTRLTSLANKQRGGTFISTAIIGALTALIVTTCVAPPLVGALAVIGQTGDVTRGASALFALSIGMGTPLLLVGASAGKLLPRVGPWMNTIKAGFGVMMIGISIWMLERILPGSLTLALYALLVFLSGVFLGAFEPLPESPAPARRLAKGIGVLACLYGALMLIGATLGGHNPLQPLSAAVGIGGGSGQAEGHAGLEFQDVESVAQLDGLLATARSSGMPVMIDFTADWCVSCREMEAYTFPAAQVIAALEPFMLLRADVTDNDDDDQALLQRFSSFGPPTIAFFDSAGREQNDYKLVGYVPAEDFSAHASRLASL
jgi:thiol:disulfide interchange protein DsbD